MPSKRSRRLSLIMMIFVLLGLILAIARSVFYEKSMDLIRNDMLSKSYRDASKKLDRLLSLPFMNSDEALYYKGLCNYFTGKHADAISNWATITTGSEYQHDVALKTGEWLESRGRLDEAETVYRKALEIKGSKSNEIRHLLLQLLWLEQRLFESAKLIEANWFEQNKTIGPADTRAIANLRAHLSIDQEVYPIEHVRDRLSALAEINPKDPGVLLGLSSLYLRTGDSANARKVIDSIISTNNINLNHAINIIRIQIALNENNMKDMREILADSSSEPLPPDLSIKVASGLLKESQEFDKLVTLLRNYLNLYPSDVMAIEELAELLFSNGSISEATELRISRKAIDQTLRDYSHLIGSDFQSNALKLAEMSDKLGRWFEAYAFMSLNASLNPEKIFPPESANSLLKKMALAQDIISLKPIIQTKSGIKPNTAPTNEDRLQETPGIPYFHEVAERSGVNHLFQNGRTPARQLPETMSGGLALIDFNNDGWQDIFLLQGGDFPHKSIDGDTKKGDRLFKNLGDGTFIDITDKAGLPDSASGYSHGVTIGDINNDGFDDIFITRYGSYCLYLNQRNGKFRDATNEWKLGGNRDWPTSASFADFDNDGDLDLYVCHYVVWDTANPRICGNENGGPVSYCVPHVLASQPDHLFRNDGDFFTDISNESGITGSDIDGRGLGIVTADFDDDGLIDIFVANDGTADFLFKNKGGLVFENIAFESGVAANSNGGFQAGMGVGCGDFNRDLRLDLIVTNFYGESTSYFENMGNSLFRERSAGIGLKDRTRFKLGFGTAFADFNNDGVPDIFTVNGHVNDLRPVIPYQMPPQLLFGQQDGRLFDPGQSTGPALQAESLGRGLVVGDLNNDGLQDAIELSLGSPLKVFLNGGLTGNQQSPKNTSFITFKLVGVKSNRSAIGTRVIATFGDKKSLQYRFGGGSYQSSSDSRLHFGLGDCQKLDQIEVQWPNGQIDIFHDVEANLGYQVTEGTNQLAIIPGFQKNSPAIDDQKAGANVK